MLNHPCLTLLCELSDLALAEVNRQLRTTTMAERSRPDGHGGSDVMYALDREVEGQLVAHLESVAESLGGIVLVAEGIGETEVTSYPSGISDADCAWRMIMDPIDGTRGIMMDKRSAWFLAGVAPNHGEATCLRHIDCAVMGELPTSRAAVADRFVAVRGQGTEGVRKSFSDDQTDIPVKVAPYPGQSIRGGFAQFVRYFPPSRDVIANLEEEVITNLFPDAVPGEILCFEDQYISSGGQLAELMLGRDRFTADVRATVYAALHSEGRRAGHVCHPYDLAGMLVAQEAGVRMTTPMGRDLDAPFDTRTAVDWVGFANEAIQTEIAPVLKAVLDRRGWLVS